MSNASEDNFFLKFRSVKGVQLSGCTVSEYNLFYGIALHSLQFYHLKTLCRNNMEHVKTLFSDPMRFSLG